MASPATRRTRSQDGIVLPASLIAISLVAVAIAAVVFVLTARPSQQDVTASTPTQTPTATPTETASATPTAKPTHKPKPPVDRGSIYVVVFNNSNIAGLAARGSEKATAAGWNVVGTDNWVGTIATSTVYAPPRLMRAAKLLASDLGIGRVREAVAPMQLDRLTVILTSELN